MSSLSTKTDLLLCPGNCALCFTYINPLNNSMKQVFVILVLQIRKVSLGLQVTKLGFENCGLLVCVTSNPLHLPLLQPPDSYFSPPRTFQNVSCLYLGNKGMGRNSSKNILYLVSFLSVGAENVFPPPHISLHWWCTQLTLSRFIWELFGGSSRMFSGLELWSDLFLTWLVFGQIGH